MILDLTPNSEMEEFHTYYVETLGVWVHNTDCAIVEDPCFAAGTLVRTKEGMKPIEEIQVGDWVMSHPEEDPLPPKYRLLEEQNAYRQVTKTFVHENKKISRVTYLNFAGGGEETLLVTPNHPIWVKYVGWTAVADLQVGHTLVMDNGGNNIVSKVQHTEDTARVYNIEVDEFHTYFVGNMQVWVHNKNPSVFAMNKIADLKANVGKQLVYRDPYFENTAPKNSNIQNILTGQTAEALAKSMMEARRADFVSGLAS